MSLHLSEAQYADVLTYLQEAEDRAFCDNAPATASRIRAAVSILEAQHDPEPVESDEFLGGYKPGLAF